MNRRQAGTIILGIGAASYSRILGANDRLNVALVGSGRRGRDVMSAMLSSGRSRLAVLCDVYDEQRNRAKSVLVKGADKPAECVAVEEALANREVDAVLLATPDHLHVDLACLALAAQKHVYMEKPTTHRFDEQKRLRQAAAASNKILQCGTQQRSGAHYIRAKEELFSSGKLGKVVIVRTMWSDFPWQTRNIQPRTKPENLDWERFLGRAPKRPFEWIRYDSWRYFPDYGNGLLADILTHWADVAQWMMDAKHPLSAVTDGGIYALHDGRENPDTVNSILQYPDWNLTFESSVLPLKDQTPGVEFLGTEGSLNITRERYIFTPNKGQPQTVQAQGPLEIAHTANFLDAVQKGTRQSATVEIGIEACNPVHLARLAYIKKARVTWPELAS